LDRRVAALERALGNVATKTDIADLKFDLAGTQRRLQKEMVGRAKWGPLYDLGPRWVVMVLIALLIVFGFFIR
jgi:hypothetical protein